MHLEDVGASRQVGGLDGDLPVEAAGPQQCRVQHVGTVRRGDQDHATAHVEAVHLDEQLVQGLLPLVVTAAHTGAAVPPDGVDLVDEHDGGGRLLRLLEQVPDPGGADADEHLDEVGAGDGEERHPGLPRDGACEEGLAGAGRAVEQHALGDLRAELLEFRRLRQELLDLLQLLDGLVDARNVGEGGFGHVLAGEFRLRLAEAERAAGAAAVDHPHHHEETDAQQQERQARVQQGGQDSRGGVAGHPVVERPGGRTLLEDLDEAVDLAPHPVGLYALPGVRGDLDDLLTVDDGDFLQLLITL